MFDELKQRDQTIVSLKKDYEIKIAKLIEEKDKFHKDKVQQLNKEKTSEIALRMENIYKEMDYARSTHVKEKQEMIEEIKLLKSKIDELSQNNQQNDTQTPTQTEVNTNKVSSSEEIKSDWNELDITIDCSNSEELQKTLNIQEIDSIKSIAISRFDQIKEDQLIKLNSFIERFTNKKWDILVVESNGKSLSELYTLIESLSIMLPNVSESIKLKGFNIDSISFKQLIESIYNVTNFTLIDWQLDLKSNLKFEVPSEFKLKNFELSNVDIKDNQIGSSVKSKVNALVQSMLKVDFFKNLCKAEISKITKFEKKFSDIIWSLWQTQKLKNFS